MWRPSVEMKNGEVFSAKKIRELSVFVINKFSEEGLSYDMALIVMDDIRDLLGEYTQINSLDMEDKFISAFERFPAVYTK